MHYYYYYYDILVFLHIYLMTWIRNEFIWGARRKSAGMSLMFTLKFLYNL